MQGKTLPPRELPEGFLQALVYDPAALAVFGELSGTARDYFIRRARRAASREEMSSLVKLLNGH